DHILGASVGIQSQPVREWFRDEYGPGILRQPIIGRCPKLRHLGRGNLSRGDSMCKTHKVTTTITITPVDAMRAKKIMPRDLARRRGWTLKYVYDLLAAGRIHGAKKVGKKWSIPADSLRQFGPNGERP